jgi:uncharacterized protein YyaL (SSP411 family)
LWKERRDEVNKEAERVFADLQQAQKPSGGGQLSAALLDDAFAALAASFDAENGGFGRAPKFPAPLSLELMLRYHFRTGRELALRTVVQTLDAMASGGIRDHIGGGFHRYSTDRQWLVPHFEKMLYDNALLAVTYIHGYQVTRDPKLAAAAKDTLGWMLAELESDDGGFFSAQDADTEEGEGVYYTWTPEEVGTFLDERESEVFRHFYGVTKNGNFEKGRTILHVALAPEETASKFGMTAPELDEILSKSRRLLYQARLGRPRPATDTKILTSWNGLAITAMAQAHKTFGDSSYLQAAKRAAEFILSKSYKEGTLLRRVVDGQAGIPGMLEDYSFLGLGLLDLFEATSEPRWLGQSVPLAEKMRGLFEDASEGGFFTSASEIPARMLETYDGPVPSGNSAAVMFLLRLAKITGNEHFLLSADRALRRFETVMESEPTSHAFMLQSADAVLNGTRELVVSAPSMAKAEPFLKSLRGSHIPDVMSFVLTSENAEEISKLSPLAEGRNPGSQTRAYLCQNFACKLPAKSPAELEAQLDIARS